MSTMFVLLLAISGYGVGPASDAASWVAGSLILVYRLSYNITVGCVGYSVVSKIPSMRNKSNTVSLARCAYNIVLTYP
jgi:SP family general alpha glucoside:H+ symporter-like MFS transporter